MNYMGAIRGRAPAAHNTADDLISLTRALSVVGAEKDIIGGYDLVIDDYILDENNVVHRRFVCGWRTS